MTPLRSNIVSGLVQEYTTLPRATFPVKMICIHLIGFIFILMGSHSVICFTIQIRTKIEGFFLFLFPEEVCVNPMISYSDSCNCSDSSDIELNDEWVGKKSPKLSRGSRSSKLHLTKTKQAMGEGAINLTSTKGSHCLRPKFPPKCNNKTWRPSSVCLKQCSKFTKCSMNGGQIRSEVLMRSL